MESIWLGSVDSHVHAYGIDDFEYFEDYRKRQGFSHINFVSVSCSRAREFAQNAIALNMKRRSPNAYAHASLIYDELPVIAGERNALDFARQAAEYRTAGFDGIKILESKPTHFKLTRLKLSDPTYDPFFADLEDNGTHIVWHACDPAPFWDADTAPAFAREHGWFYGDGTFETKESLRDDVIAVLRKHPRLNATMAHFFFLSDDLELAEALMDEFPRLCFDITPGREMYDNFTRDYERARAFFHKYADRLHFGTDMMKSEFQGDQSSLINAMRRFLITEDKFTYWDFEMRGVGLPADKARAIAGGNFRRDVGDVPREIDQSYLDELLDKAAEQLKEEAVNAD